MKSPADILTENVNLAFNASHYNSRRKLSADSDVSLSVVGKIMAGEVGKNGPGTFPLRRIADNLGTSLDQLVPPKRDTSTRPTTQQFLGIARPEVLSKARQEHRLLSDFADILDYCDLYREPKAGQARITRVGPYSVLGEKTQVLDAALQQIDYESWSKERQQKSFKWQRLAWDKGVYTLFEYFEGRYKSSKRNLEGPVLMSACRLTDNLFSDNLEERLLVFVEQVWQ